MPVEELVASLKGVRDTREGLRSISDSAGAADADVQSLTRSVSAVASTLSAVSATATALRVTTGAISDETEKTLRDVAQTVTFIQSAVEGLETLPAVLSRLGISAGAAGAAGLAIGATAAAVGGTLFLTVKQFQEFEDRFNDEIVNLAKARRLAASNAKRIDTIARERRREAEVDNENSIRVVLMMKALANSSDTPAARVGAVVPSVEDMEMQLRRAFKEGFEAERAARGNGD